MDVDTHAATEGELPPLTPFALMLSADSVADSGDFLIKLTPRATCSLISFLIKHSMSTVLTG